jgi:hypothetical protein
MARSAMISRFLAAANRHLRAFWQRIPRRRSLRPQHWVFEGSHINRRVLPIILAPMIAHNERQQRAQQKLAEVLAARSTPFEIARTLTACWRYSIGDDDGAAYGLVEHGVELWELIKQAVEFERNCAQ